MLTNKIQVNSSLIKALFYKGEIRDYCPTKIQALFLHGVESQPTESMKKGLYFETKAIGGSARGSSMHDLPRKLITKKQKDAGAVIGDKTIDQERIDLQVLTFKQKVKHFEMSIMPNVNIQVKIYKQHPLFEDTLLTGELDIFPITFVHPIYGLILAWIDMKLTKDLTKDFGEYSYKYPGSLDPIQPWMYHELITDIDMGLNMSINPNCKLPQTLTPEIISYIQSGNVLGFYWVFDYGVSKKKPKLKDTFIEWRYNNTARNELYEAVRKTRKIMIEMKEQCPPAYPTAENCSNCPLECKFRYLKDSDSNDIPQFQTYN